jgi:hypothetical protein
MERRVGGGRQTSTTDPQTGASRSAGQPILLTTSRLSTEELLPLAPRRSSVLLDKALTWAFSEGAGHNSWLGPVPPPTDRDAEDILAAQNFSCR